MLSALVIAGRFLLAAVFALAGVTKLVDPAGTRKAVVDFGSPERVAPTLAIVVPLAELAVAALLLPTTTALVGALGALALLVVFSGAIAWNLAHGRSPDCHCFGQLHSAPASWRTLARNAVLAGLAILAIGGTIAAPDASATTWIGSLEGAELLALVVGAAAVVLLAVGVLAFVSLMRSYGGVLVRLDRIESALAEAGVEIGEAEELPEIGFEPGTPSPQFGASTLSGEPVSLETITSSGKPALLLFTSPRCGPCKTLLPTASDWQSEYGDELTIVFAIDATVDEARAEADEFGLENVVVDDGHRLHELFQGNGTPSAVLIATDGTIGSWVASGSDWIEQLVAQVVAGGEDVAQGLPVGADVPALELRSLDGENVSLESLRGRDTLLLFWNPDCGFCRSMHDDVLAWEKSANGVHPRLVVVSSGDEAATRAEGFRSLVLLDESFAAGSAFAANGTPMAVRIDADGRVASDVAAGADAVLALAGTNGRVTT